MMGDAGRADPAEPVDVSLVQLISAPERFRGKLVRFSGFVASEHEGDAAYLYREDYEELLTRNGIWLDWNESVAAKPEGAAYAIVEGTFDPDSGGHMALYSGTLRRIVRCARLPHLRGAQGSGGESGVRQ